MFDRICIGAALLCPLFLTHGRGLAEACIDTAAILFLLRSVVSGGWFWLRTPWVGMAALWWVWLCICSMPFGPFGAGGWPGLFQALMTVRFLVFAACLQHVALRDDRVRRAMRWIVVACCLYIAAQMLIQAVLGFNLFGDPRFGDGTLTGPYDKPRAAAPLSRLLLPVMLAGSVWLAARVGAVRGRIPGGIVAAAPLLAGIAVMVLAGQRMPLLLLLFGLLVSGLFLRSLRPILLGVLVLAPALVAASALVSPESFGHLVLLFQRQMEHFGRSPYGLIFNRAASIAYSNPLTGLGFDGFRHGCDDPAYFHAWPPWGDRPGDGGGADICVQHAHNHALQALTDAGVPGLILFAAMVVFWLAALGRGLLRRRPGTDGTLFAWRVGLFAAVFIHEWPIASSSAFTNMPLGGWFFLLLGVGLSEAYIERRRILPRSEP